MLGRLPIHLYKSASNASGKSRSSSVSSSISHQEGTIKQPPRAHPLPFLPSSNHQVHNSFLLAFHKAYSVPEPVNITTTDLSFPVPFSSEFRSEFTSISPQIHSPNSFTETWRHHRLLVIVLALPSRQKEQDCQAFQDPSTLAPLSRIFGLLKILDNLIGDVETLQIQVNKMEALEKAHSDLERGLDKRYLNSSSILHDFEELQNLECKPALTMEDFIEARGKLARIMDGIQPGEEGTLTTGRRMLRGVFRK